MQLLFKKPGQKLFHSFKSKTWYQKLMIVEVGLWLLFKLWQGFIYKFYKIKV